jgi:hypothetical protein
MPAAMMRSTANPEAKPMIKFLRDGPFPLADPSPVTVFDALELGDNVYGSLTMPDSA